MTYSPTLENLQLLIEAYSDAARTLRIKGLTSKGAIFDKKLILTGNKALNSDTVTFPSDTLSIVATLTATGVKRGRCYGSIVVLEKGDNKADIVDALTAGYIYDNRPLKWHWLSGGIIEGPTDGLGFQKDLVTSLPGAAGTGDSGGEWVETVPSNTQYKIKLGNASFTASATVATRTPTIQIRDDSGNIRFTIVMPNVTASQGRGIEFGPLGFTETSFDGANLARFGTPFELILPEGWDLKSVVSGSGIRMGDQWTSVFHLMEELIQE